MRHARRLGLVVLCAPAGRPARRRQLHGHEHQRLGRRLAPRRRSSTPTRTPGLRPDHLRHRRARASTRSRSRRRFPTITDAVEILGFTPARLEPEHQRPGAARQLRAPDRDRRHQLGRRHRRRRAADREPRRVHRRGPRHQPRAGRRDPGQRRDGARSSGCFIGTDPTGRPRSPTPTESRSMEDPRTSRSAARSPHSATSSRGTPGSQIGFGCYIGRRHRATSIQGNFIGPDASGTASPAGAPARQPDRRQPLLRRDERDDRRRDGRGAQRHLRQHLHGHPHLEQFLRRLRHGHRGAGQLHRHRPDRHSAARQRRPGDQHQHGRQRLLDNVDLRQPRRRRRHRLRQPADGALVQGNKIGTDVTGTLPAAEPRLGHATSMAGGVQIGGTGRGRGEHDRLQRHDEPGGHPHRGRDRQHDPRQLDPRQRRSRDRPRSRSVSTRTTSSTATPGRTTSRTSPCSAP